MILDQKLVQRAKDLAARDSTQAYMETLQHELKQAVVAGVMGELPEDPHVLVSITGTHVHEAVVMDQHGHALLITVVWHLSEDATRIAEAVGRSRAEGQA